MFQDAFIKLEENECREILEEITPVLEGGGYSADAVTILGQDLSFYPGYRFLDIADYSTMPPFRRFVIHKSGDAVALDWTNRPVYELNDKAPLGLTRETVRDYIRFFFSYVRGPHGKFVLAESVDDIEWREEPPPAARKALGRLLQPVTITARGTDGSFRLSVCLMFKNALYRVTVPVTSNGRVSMEEETILVDDIPVLDNVLGQ